MNTNPKLGSEIGKLYFNDNQLMAIMACTINHFLMKLKCFYQLPVA